MLSQKIFKMIKVELALCLILALACTAGALQCYQCSSCSTVSDSQLKVCDSYSSWRSDEPTQCTKTTSVSGTISRRCGTSGDPNGCYLTGGYGSMEVCTCSGNACNGNSFNKAAALKCYQCSTCNAVDDSQLEGCHVVAKQCYKSISRRGVEARGCAAKEGKDGCVWDGEVEHCLCTGDGCNDNMFGNAGALKCYSCSSHYPCGIVGDSHLKACHGKATQCYKFGDRDRGCADTGGQNGCVSTKGLEYCYCAGDACNDNILGPAGAVKCYSCSHCSSVNETQLKTCPRAATQCYKFSSMSYFPTNLGAVTVSRGCADRTGQNGCVSSTGKEYCFCSGDKCNGAGRVYLSGMIATLVCSLTGYLHQYKQY